MPRAPRPWERANSLAFFSPSMPWPSRPTASRSCSRPPTPIAMAASTWKSLCPGSSATTLLTCGVHLRGCSSNRRCSGPTRPTSLRWRSGRRAVPRRWHAWSWRTETSITSSWKCGAALCRSSSPKKARLFFSRRPSSGTTDCRHCSRSSTRRRQTLEVYLSSSQLSATCSVDPSSSGPRLSWPREAMLETSRRCQASSCASSRRSALEKRRCRHCSGRLWKS
mmetsp:Transcript_95457/g.269916  ORF Transcript_95457/g.269916 Transcript_95457/m.269916 type:complete len:223 (+) Transcript_95457:114-782(+)